MGMVDSVFRFWCCCGCTIGGRWIWLQHSTSDCHGMHYDAKVSPQYVPCWYCYAGSCPQEEIWRQTWTCNQLSFHVGRGGEIICFKASFLYLLHNLLIYNVIITCTWSSLLKPSLVSCLSELLS